MSIGLINEFWEILSLLFLNKFRSARTRAREWHYE